MKRFLRWIFPKRKFTKGDKVLFLGKTREIYIHKGDRKYHKFSYEQVSIEYCEELLVMKNVRFRRSVKVRGKLLYDYYSYVHFRLPTKSVAIKEYALINWKRRIQNG